MGNFSKIFGKSPMTSQKNMSLDHLVKTSSILTRYTRQPKKKTVPGLRTKKERINSILKSVQSICQFKVSAL